MAPRRPPGPTLGWSLGASLVARFHPRRLRRRLPLALAAAAAVAVLPQLGARQAQPPAGTRAVLVAVTDLQPGRALAPHDVRRVQASAVAVPADAVADLPAGAVVRSPIAQGEVVAARRLGSGPGLAARLDPDRRAVTLPWPQARTPLEAGETVDVVATTVDDRSGAVRTRVVALAAPVLATDDDGVTVAVPAGTVTAVVEALATGTVDLALTPFRQ